MKPYEIIEHTADVGIKANGKTLKELFENTAKGMFNIIEGEKTHQINSQKTCQKIEIKKEIDDFEELLVSWLSELLYIFNKEEILFDSFRIFELNNDSILGEARGERIDFSRNTLQTEIKAVTFHNLKIEEDISGFHCSVIFDV